MYFWYFLAEQMGRSVREVQANVDGEEFCYWHAYYALKNGSQDYGRPIEDLTQEQVDQSIDAAVAPYLVKT